MLAWTQLDADLWLEKYARHKVSSVFYYPWWKPKNLWRNHWGQHKAVNHEINASMIEEDSMNSYLLDCAIARLEGYLKCKEQGVFPEVT